MKIKLPVAQLEHGMYIAELDRPWIGTPFLFQGFLLDSDEDMAQLRLTCEFVFVDDLQSAQSMKVQRKLQAAAAGGHSGRVSRITVEFEEWNGLERLRATLNRLEDKRERATARLRELANSVENVSASTVRETRDAVISLIADVSDDPKISSWLTLISDNEEEFGSHAMNVSVWSVGFAAFLGMPADACNAIGQGAMLHDLGKSKLPKWLLRKQGRLTAQERALIRHHAAYGAKLLSGVADTDPRVLEIVELHHERVDGRGYPHGFHGDRIPDHVKVVSICNAYERLTRGSGEAAGLAPAAAMQQLMAGAGTRFEPVLVEAFIRWIGVYPLGSLVRLRNGYLCLVVSTDPVRRLKPTVLLVKAPGGELIAPRKTVNLEVLARSPLAAEWSIDNIVSPAAAGIDVRRLLLEELMLQRDGVRMRQRTSISA